MQRALSEGNVESSIRRGCRGLYQKGMQRALSEGNAEGSIRRECRGLYQKGIQRALSEGNAEGSIRRGSTSHLSLINSPISLIAVFPVRFF